MIISSSEKNKNKEPVSQLECEKAGDKPNKDNPPAHLDWEPYFGYCTGKATGEVPVCPSCGEMPYSTERCEICGQAFIQDEKAIKFAEPAPVNRMMCFICGEPDGMEFTCSKLNGHKSGRCRSCGAVMME